MNPITLHLMDSYHLRYYKGEMQDKSQVYRSCDDLKLLRGLSVSKVILYGSWLMNQEVKDTVYPLFQGREINIQYSNYKSGEAK